MSAITKTKRPIIVSIASRTGLAGALFSLIYVFSPGLKKYSDFLPLGVGLFVALKFVSLVGIWHMKRWGVELFTIIYFAFLIVGILLDDVYSINWFGLFFSTAFLVIFVIYYKRMDRNL